MKWYVFHYDFSNQGLPFGDARAHKQGYYKPTLSTERTPLKRLLVVYQA